MSKGLTGMLCAFAWALSFVIILPITFEVKLLGVDWGKFGFNPLHAMCNIYACNTGLDLVGLVTSLVSSNNHSSFL